MTVPSPRSLILAEALLIALESAQNHGAPRPTAPEPAAPPRAPGALLDVSELSARLCVPVKTIYDWPSRPVPFGPPAMKIGRYLRWKPEVVEAWIAAQNED